MDKNKIDSVVDEVLESKRLKQGVSILVKGGIIFAVGFGILFFVVNFLRKKHNCYMRNLDGKF